MRINLPARHGSDADLIGTERRANSVNLKAIIQVLACTSIKPLAQIKIDKSRCVLYAHTEGATDENFMAK